MIHLGTADLDPVIGTDNELGNSRPAFLGNT